MMDSDRKQQFRAFIAIGTHKDLSALDKAVATALVEHTNEVTGRCDPSVDRLAFMLGTDRRQIVRSTKRLKSVGLIDIQRHAGMNRTAQYDVKWSELMAACEAYNARGKEHREMVRRGDGSEAAKESDDPDGSNPVVTELSPSRCQKRPLQGDKFVPQYGSYSGSYLGNAHASAREPAEQYNESGASDRQSARIETASAGPDRQQGIQGVIRSALSNPSSAQVVAEKLSQAAARWDTELMRKTGSAYANIIGWLPDEVRDRATEAEKAKRGAGIAVVLRRLQEDSPSLWREAVGR